jgi:two-component system LytT family response regulator
MNIDDEKKVCQNNPQTLAMKTIHRNGFENTLSMQHKIIFRVANGYEIIELGRVLYMEALDSYSRIILSGGQSYVVCKNLCYFENLLPSRHFWRIHKSYIINMQHVVKVLKGPPPVMVMINNQWLPISSRKKVELFEKLKWLVF